ncbi:MAG: lycopene beta-cyclase CrtY [Anaerolineae bacterium]|nr:lycopene beta-cyclase CrtY [Anaerolineae bacterium]
MQIVLTNFPSKLDIIIVGGGLAGGLIAKRLLDRNVSFLLIESSPSLGGHHTWSYHETDIPPECREWMRAFQSYRWDSHSIQFPKLSRTLETPYCTLLSSDFDSKLAPLLGNHFRPNTRVKDLNRGMVALEDGTVLEAKLVLDARGWTPQGLTAYQKFVGLEVEVEISEDSGASGGSVQWTTPMLMDATVPQLDGFRFMYTLPFSKNRFLIEDTYYSTQPDLNIPEIEKRIWNYAADRGWKIQSVLRKEVGCLPLPLTATFPLSQRSDAAIPVGLRAGLFHATTGYSLPYAVATAELLFKLWPLGLAAVESGLKNRIEDNWNQQSFYRLLNRMLFWAAKPTERYKVLEKFYSLPSPTIERFYAGSSTLFDRARILSGVLMANTIQWCCENNRHEFDFMRGDEDYKYRLGGVNRFVMRARLTR